MCVVTMNIKYSTGPLSSAILNIILEILIIII